MLKDTCGSHKPIIAMMHFPPLPGTSLYDAKGGMQKIIDSAAKDIAALQKGGVNAVMFGNEGDRPSVLQATLPTLAAYAFCGRTASPSHQSSIWRQLPLGPSGERFMDKVVRLR
jgi:predicted TIM-barrel enzyme